MTRQAREMCIWTISYRSDVQRKNVANIVNRVMFKGTVTKWPVQKQTIKTARNTQNNMTQQTFS